MSLRVWQDAIALYGLVYCGYKDASFEMKRVSSNMIASADSVHRNIAEGYCRRSIREYLQFLNFALGSLGETVSAIHAYHGAGHLTEEKFEELDELSCRLENALMKLVASLEQKKSDGDWNESLRVQEEAALYGEPQ